MNKKFVIFGCGRLGHEAIEVLGSENIECFCDNNQALTGTKQYEKTVISFEKLKEKAKDAAVIICADIRKGHAWAIADQCERNGVQDYFFYQLIREKEICSKRIELLELLANDRNRMALKCEMYIKKKEEIQKQASYLKRHIDICHIKPAGGKLREWQLTLVKEAAKLFEKLKELEIRPFLCCGNLIGYVRHNGFVPWDDDIDFALMRDDYEKLKEFCRKNMYTREEFYGEAEQGKEVEEELKSYYWGVNFGDEFDIHKPLPNGSVIIIDFFVMDYYAQDYAFEELMKVKEKIRYKLNDAMDDIPKRIECFEEALKENRVNIVKESNNIYHGIDNLLFMWNVPKSGWIPREVVFPLKKILYEGEYFYVPNDAEEFLKYEYENIWKIPDDIGLQQHAWHLGDTLADVENW